MEQSEKIVDGFRFLPPALKAWRQSFLLRPDPSAASPLDWPRGF
jgi:hypothetical protein